MDGPALFRRAGAHDRAAESAGPREARAAHIGKGRARGPTGWPAGSTRHWSHRSQATHVRTSPHPGARSRSPGGAAPEDAGARAHPRFPPLAHASPPAPAGPGGAPSPHRTSICGASGAGARPADAARPSPACPASADAAHRAAPACATPHAAAVLSGGSQSRTGEPTPAAGAPAWSGAARARFAGRSGVGGMPPPAATP